MRHILSRGGSDHGGDRQRHDRVRGSVVYGPGEPHIPSGQRKPGRRPRSGTEPRTARSDLELRRLLSRIFGVLFLIGTAIFAVLAAQTTRGTAPDRGTYIFFAALCTAFALIAAIDLLVVSRRLAARRRDPGPPEWPRRP